MEMVTECIYERKGRRGGGHTPVVSLVDPVMTVSKIYKSGRRNTNLSVKTVKTRKDLSPPV